MMPDLNHNLYCVPCRRTHSFTRQEVEKIVYTLAGMVADAEQPISEDEQENALPCLRDALDMADDQNDFAEHVEECLCNRRVFDPEPYDEEEETP